MGCKIREMEKGMSNVMKKPLRKLAIEDLIDEESQTIIIRDKPLETNSMFTTLGIKVRNVLPSSFHTTGNIKNEPRSSSNC